MLDAPSPCLVIVTGTFAFQVLPWTGTSMLPHLETHFLFSACPQVSMKRFCLATDRWLCAQRARWGEPNVLAQHMHNLGLYAQSVSLHAHRC